MDVKAWGVDWYGFSVYKTWGPHMAALYGSHSAFQDLKVLPFTMPFTVPFTVPLRHLQQRLKARLLLAQTDMFCCYVS